MKGFESVLAKDELAEHAAEVVKHSRDLAPRIDPRDFRHTQGYSPQEISEDLAFVETEKARFAQGELTGDDFEDSRSADDRLLSEALEVIVVTQAQDNWYGENVFLARSSEVDDIRNYVDVVAEVRGPTNKEHLALSIDATRSADEGRITAKIAGDLRRVLGRGGQKLASVKYFESPSTPNERRRLTDVVPVVIGIDSKDLAELVTLVAKIQRLRETARTSTAPIVKENLRRARQTLINHPAQIIFLLEMRAQVDMYLHFIEQEHPAKADQERIYALHKKLLTFQKTIDSALNTKRSIPLGNLAEDRTYLAITEITSRLKSTARL